MEDLKKLANQISSSELRRVVLDALDDPNNVLIERFGDELDFESSPASKKVHQSYPGGLVEHTLALTEMALALASVIEKIYHAELNRDILIAGGILHDFYKFLTYKKEDNRYERSRIGSKIDHLTLTVAEFYRRDISIDLLHVLVAHHGKEGAAAPRSLEALIIHLADVCDSEFMNETLLGAQEIINKLGIKVKEWNAKKALEICKIMAEKGNIGVKEYLKIKK
ncbi:MAG: HDIG domain-containing protein [Candidatus Lokiarchaeota archaeon]|nr:HDIG domain-containing protein [Candidatus Lokiarchaeota archaeon]